MSRELAAKTHFTPTVMSDTYVARVSMTAAHNRGPVLARRRLRLDLRRLREGAGLSLDQVAREMVWSISKIVRIENGSVGISANDTKALLSLYGATATEISQDLLDLAKDSRRRMWWSSYREQIPAGFLEFVGLEHDASKISHYNPFIVPGLLQTEDYARALIEIDLVVPDVATQVDIRMRRQARLFKDPDPPEYVAVIDESVLYRRFGHGHILRDQLNALLDHVREPHIDLVVVPTDTVGHPGVPIGFVILQFPDRRDAPIAFHDQHGSDVAAEAPAEVKRYFDTLARLLSMGLRGADAIAAIKAARDKAT